MARGKHGQSAARRREEESKERIDQLVRRLLAVADRRDAAAEANRSTVKLQQRLGERSRHRDIAVQDEVQRLSGVLGDLEQSVLAEEALRDRMKAAWDKFADLLVEMNGRGADGIETFLADISADRHKRTVLLGVQNEKLSPEAAQRIQRVRGLRSSSPPTPDEDRSATDPATGWIARQGERHARHRPIRDDRGVVGAWWLANRINVGWDEALLPFGAVEEAQAAAWVKSGPARTTFHADIAAATYACAGRSIPPGRWPNPLVPAPLFPRTADAAALRWWYWVMTETEELAGDLAHDPGRVHEHGPFSSSEPLTDEGRLWREVADMLASATLFWLPPGQALSYLASQPLEAADRDDLRLPYQRTLVVPSEALVLEPLPGAVLTAAQRDGLRDNIVEAQRLAASMAAVPDDIGVGRRLDLGTAVRACGARVEAVLLEADAAGRPGPRVVWCLAVPTPDGSAVLGRFTVPAWRAQTVWADALDQLAAVAAWGDWVDPPPGRSVGDGDIATHPERERSPITHGWLRVLDVRRAEQRSGAEPTGRKVAPHVRRGHWRRQHHGPSGREVKRVRIAPTLVNAGSGPLAPRVYRLPNPPAPTPPAEPHAPPRGS